MKPTINKKLAIQLVSIVCAILIIAPVCNAGIKTDNTKKISESKEKIENYKASMGGTEYWALLVGVGVYLNHPNQDRPSMLEAVDDLQEVLLNSPLWEADHIHVLKGAKATTRNLIRELFWLIRNEDKNDMSLIYITTHGGPIKDKNNKTLDLFPRDETDKADEILIMYQGFEKWYGKLWDDFLKFMLRLLQSKGICIIIDSCHSGGFDDLESNGRLLLMSCREDELSYGSKFSEYLIEGFWGEADAFGNKDGVNSAQEAFNYADYHVNGKQNPMMIDKYNFEFPVTFP